MKKKKKKRNYPLKFYKVEFEYTGYGSTYVQAECESQARSIAENDSEVPFDNVEIEEVDKDDMDMDDEMVLDENGNYMSKEKQNNEQRIYGDDRK